MNRVGLRIGILYSWIFFYKQGSGSPNKEQAYCLADFPLWLFAKRLCLYASVRI